MPQVRDLLNSSPKFPDRSPLRHIELVPNSGDRDRRESVRIRRRVVRVGTGERSAPARHAAVVQRRGRRRGALVHGRTLLPAPAERQRRGRGGPPEHRVHARRRAASRRAQNHEPPPLCYWGAG